MSPSLSVRTSCRAVVSVSVLRGNKTLRKNRNLALPIRSTVAIGNCVTTVEAPTSASRSRHNVTHSINCSGGTPYNKSLPMSVTSAAVGNGGRRCKSCQSAQGKIPGIFLPQSVESCPYDLPWPIAAMISIGSSQVRRATLTIVANDRVRLLAPNKTTRRVGDGRVTTERLWVEATTSTGNLKFRRLERVAPLSPMCPVTL